MAVPLRQDDAPSPSPAPRAPAERAPCIVVAGESNSGKSSVVNLILRQPVLPVSAAAADIALTSLYPAARRGFRALGPGGRLLEHATAEGLFAQPGLARVEVEVVQADAAPLVIHEVALAQDRPTTEPQRAALAAADLLIWCTMAQRAWSRTEISLVDALPARLQGAALLAVTRCDLLPDSNARQRVRDRLVRETRGRFAAIAMLDSGRACQASLGDPRAWRQSGGEALVEALHAGLAAAAPRCGPPPPGPPRLAEVAAALARGASPAPTDWSATLHSFLDAADRDPAPDARRLATTLAGAMAQVIEALPRGTGAIGYLRGAYAAELARICETREAGGLAGALPPLVDLALQLEEDLGLLPYPPPTSVEPT